MTSPSNWTRTSSLGAPEQQAKERWYAPDGRAFDLRVRFGKRVDIFGLKKQTFERFSATIDEISTSRRAMYAPSNVAPVKACPICAHPSAEQRALVEIYGAKYLECVVCAHVYVENRMTDEAIQRFYGSSKAYASTYTNKASAAIRVEQVAKPKAEWALAAFRAKYGRDPKRMLDIGAGGGHFVKAARDLGLSCDGVEVSDWSRTFAREHFDIELINKDFVRDHASFEGVELVTFWGVIEHVPEPADLVRATRQVLGPEGMIVTAVPRWTALSAAVQLLFPDTLVRHMDPGGHIHLFSDNSLLTLLDDEGFDPVEAWWFGMDVYELATQMIHRSGDAEFGDKIMKIYPHLQPWVDSFRFSDEITIAGVPRRG